MGKAVQMGTHDPSSRTIDVPARPTPAPTASPASASASGRTSAPVSAWSASASSGSASASVAARARVALDSLEHLVSGLGTGILALLRAESLDVVATAGDPDAFLDTVDAERPDVAIVDVRMPPTHTDEGIVAAVEDRRCRPDLAVLALSAYVEQAFATSLLVRGSARLGYLLKERAGRVEEFLGALHRVAEGGTAIDPEAV